MLKKQNAFMGRHQKGIYKYLTRKYAYVKHKWTTHFSYMEID